MKYRVKTLSFIGGALVAAGTVITLPDGVTPGSNLEPHDEEAKAAAAHADQPAPAMVSDAEHKVALAHIADLEQALTVVKEGRDAADEAAEAAKARVAELEARLSAATAPKAGEKPPAPPPPPPKAATKTDKT